MYKHANACRCCSAKDIEPVFNLGLQPLANNFTRYTDPKSGYAPLEVMFCPHCTMAQLSVVVDPLVLYSDYAYVTSPSTTMRDHFRLLWNNIELVSPTRSVLEVGSNDGRFLDFCLDQGASRVCGVDPAENLRPISDERLHAICSLFTCDSARQAREFLCGTDVIVARHVFGHVDDLDRFMAAVTVASSTETLVVIEVPYVLDMLSRREFDTIYHEHLSYFSVRAIEALLSRTEFRMHKILRFNIHGGAIAIMLRHRWHPSVPDASVAHFLASEEITRNSWHAFDGGCREQIIKMQTFVHSFDSVCGYAASAKSTVWMNACGFTFEDIPFICDYTPQKIGREAPGSRVPIVPESALLAEQTDAAVMFAWNFRDEVLTRNHTYLERGGSFIIPGREIEVVNIQNLAQHIPVKA